MNLEVLPARVRARLYLFWAGMAFSGLGIVGFFLSFWQVGSPEQAAIDVHTAIPVVAYASIFAWVAGLAVMWYCRRKLDADVANRLRDNRGELLGDLDPTPAGEHDNAAASAPVGRDT